MRWEGLSDGHVYCGAFRCLSAQARTNHLHQSYLQLSWLCYTAQPRKDVSFQEEKPGPDALEPHYNVP